ncbi:M16 family metallopeptidase [Desulfovibrio legallii]|uniref:M16 family metallopeptidase n=1 Tax=Desulfovibrio legallii TaxID=571438 RepID=UPI000E4D1A0A|nr:pitrilysin family protein [Desulfovibrio legallii]RHH24221.1 insulinase family protein [Desulfovibrio sp. AM18-2]
MARHGFLLTLFFLLLATSASAAQAAPGKDMLLTRLPNGLTVCIVKDTRFPLAATRLYVRTGSANETAAQAGISHLLEHMVFKGTEHRPKGQVAKDVEALGGYLNAATSFDKTWFITDMPAAHWRTGMDVVKEMAFQASLDPKELESEKKVVISELERDQDQPMSRLFESLQTSTLHNTVYGRPVIGYKDTVRAVTADDLRAYVRRWYQPRNMLLLVAGDVDPQAVLEHARQLFGGLTNSGDQAAPAPVDLSAAPGGPQVEVIRGPWSKVYLGLAFPAPALSDVRSTDLDVLSYLLGGDGTSLFYRKYKYEQQLVDSIGMGNMSLARAGLLYLSAQMDADKLEPFWQGLTKDLASLAAKDFSDESVRRAVFNLEDGMDRSSETLSGLAAWTGSVQFDLGGAQAEANMRAALGSVDQNRLRTALSRWLQPQALRVRVLAPEKAQLPDLEAILRANWPAPAAPKGPAPQAADAAKAETFDLGGGRTLILLPDATVPYAAVQLSFPGGNALLAAENQGLAGLTARTLTDGCADLDAQGVERWLAQRAASLDASAGLQTFTVSLTGPARFNADYFALLQDLLTKPRFEEQEVRREVSDMLSDLRQRADRPTGLLFSRLNPFLYPNGQPYGLDPLGTPESLARFTPKDVRGFWEQQLRQPWVLAVAGDFDREAVLTFARSLPVPQGKALSVSLPVWGTDKKLDLHLPGRNQAHVLEVFRAVPPDHPDAPALLLLQAVLSGQSGLLFSQMRDVEGLGYTVTAFYRAMPLAGMMAFYIGTTPDKVEQARQGFARIIAQVQAKALPEELLRAAVNRLRGEYYRDRQSLGARAGESATDAVLGRPQGFDLTLIDKAAKLSPEQVQTAARIYLTPPNRYDLLLQP